MRPPTRRIAGFTLTELLCMVLVISLLASLVVSGLIKARHRTDRTTCAYHLQQIGLALRAYGADHCGHLPPNDSDWEPLCAGPYLPERSVLVCPAVRTRESVASRFFGRHPLSKSPLYDYRGGLCDDDDPLLDVAWDHEPGIHQGRTNVLHLDGHVEPAAPGQGVRGP